MEEKTKKNIEFIDSKIEKEEIRGFSIKGFVDGSILTLKALSKQIPFILFLVLLAIIYIANRYNAEKITRKYISLKEKVKDLRAEQITTASELMILSRPSQVEKLVEKKDLGLKEPIKPPYVIKSKE